MSGRRAGCSPDGAATCLPRAQFRPAVSRAVHVGYPAGARPSRSAGLESSPGAWLCRLASPVASPLLMPILRAVMGTKWVKHPTEGKWHTVCSAHERGTVCHRGCDCTFQPDTGTDYFAKHCRAFTKPKHDYLSYDDYRAR